LLSLSEGERVTSVIPVSEFAGDQYLLMLTVNGYIKKVSLNAFSAIRATGIIAIQLVHFTSSLFALLAYGNKIACGSESLLFENCRFLVMN